MNSERVKSVLGPTMFQWRADFVRQYHWHSCTRIPAHIQQTILATN